MTTETPVEQVVAHLEKAGFRRLTERLELASLPFDFPAVLVRDSSEADLVVVADSVEEDGKSLRRKIEGMARALDVLGSRRSITAVVAGPRPNNDILEDISRVCRILPVGDSADDTLEESLKNWLRVLTPLSIENLDAHLSDPMSRFSMPSEAVDPMRLSRLVEASLRGVEDVIETVEDYLREALKPVQEAS